MPRKRSEKNQRRDKMLEIFQQLDAVGQEFALRYVEKLMELQKLEAFVDKVNENRSTGSEACSFCGKPKEEVIMYNKLRKLKRAKRRHSLQALVE